MRLFNEINTSLADRAKARDVILWWERRRLAYNVMVAAFCVVFTIFEVPTASLKMLMMVGSDEGWHALVALPQIMMETAIVPIIIWVILQICSNLWFTGGWLIELLLRLFLKDKFLRFGPIAFWSGTVFSFLFSAFWLALPNISAFLY